MRTAFHTNFPYWQCVREASLTGEAWEAAEVTDLEKRVRRFELLNTPPLANIDPALLDRLGLVWRPEKKGRDE